MNVKKNSYIRIHLLVIQSTFDCIQTFFYFSIVVRESVYFLCVYKSLVHKRHVKASCLFASTTFLKLKKRV